MRKKIYRSKNKEKVCQCRKKYYNKNKEAIKAKEREKYSKDSEPKKQKERERYSKDSSPKKQKEREKYSKHSGPKKQKEREKYSKDSENKKGKVNEYKEKKRIELLHDDDKILQNFYRFSQHGPIFPCVSCHRRLHERTVKAIDDEFGAFITENNLTEFLKISPEFEVFGRKYICNTCRRYLLKKDTPPLNFTNGLDVDSTPEWMSELSSVGKSLVALDLPFLKVREIDKTGMPVTNDRYINVPRTLDEVSKTVNTLPRKSDELGFINVRIKRKMGLKTYHRFERVNGQLVNRVLDYLKGNNELYKEIQINEMKNELVHIDSSRSGSSSSSLSSSSKSSASQKINSSISSASDCSMISDDSMRSAKLSKKRTPFVQLGDDDNVFMNVTCLLPEDPAREVVINTSDKVIKKKLKRSDPCHFEIAPGEGKIPNNWLRAPHFLLRAFPLLFPKGRYGFYHERKIPLTPLQFFTQRILNINTQFSRDPDFLFVAEQFCERWAIERQIDISCKKGTFTKTQQGTVELSMVDDAFGIFKSIPGTPAYWKKFRNEIFARMEQLGPFHIFFTFSCAEMRWPNFIAAVWQEKGHQIKFTTNPWDGKWDSIEIKHKDSGDEGPFVPLPQFNERHMRSQTAFFRDHYILVTRMFDSRVKAFITSILKHKVAYYSYRVEFQARGLPHIHGKNETEHVFVVANEEQQ